MKCLGLTQWPLVVVLLLGTGMSIDAFGEYNADKILLSELKAVTLYQGRMTNARRSPPVPQLKCVGGSAQHKFQPKVVQCINQGTDGFDIQWECKTDMDNAYRFGQVQVSCEGYDYPNDPYVLRGSCGLEYTIEFTEEGLAKERQSGHSYSSYSQKQSHKSSGGGDGLFWFIAILVGMFVIYKKCIAPAGAHQGAASPPQGTTQPPPYGFRPEFMPPPQGPPPTYESTQSSAYPDQGCSGSAYTHASAPPPPADSGTAHTSGGGFWSGAATGGVLGYMLGNNRDSWGTRNRGSWGANQEHHHHHHHQDTSRTGSFFSNTSSTSSDSAPSSGTRTASGFGGTSRR